MCRNVAEVGDGVAMKTMDIFAGCGGLSEGMHQAKAADTRCSHSSALVTPHRPIPRCMLQKCTLVIAELLLKCLLSPVPHWYSDALLARPRSAARCHDAICATETLETPHEPDDVVN